MPKQDTSYFLNEIEKLCNSFNADNSIDKMKIINFICKDLFNKNNTQKHLEHKIEDFLRNLVIYTNKPLNEKIIIYLLSKSSFLKRLNNCCNLYQSLDYAHAHSIILTICSLVIYTQRFTSCYSIYKIIYYTINIINLIFDSKKKELNDECKLCVSILHKDDNALKVLIKHISKFYSIDYKKLVESFEKEFNNIH